MAMWKYYHGLELENSINEYIDSIQAIEKNIPSDKIMNQIQLVYERDIKDKLENAKEKLKDVNQYHHLKKMEARNR